MSAAQNKESIRHIYAALEKGDRAPFAAAVHPDYVWRLAGHSSWSRRFEAIRQQMIKPLLALIRNAIPFAGCQPYWQARWAL